MLGDVRQQIISHILPLPCALHIHLLDLLPLVHYHHTHSSPQVLIRSILYH